MWPGSWAAMVDPGVALKALEFADFTQGEARFEVPSLQRFQGEAAAPFLQPQDIPDEIDDYWISYATDMAQNDPDSDDITLAIVDGYFDVRPGDYEDVDRSIINWADRGLDTLAWDLQGSDAHGTACAGVAAAKRLPGQSQSIFPGLRILPVRVYDPAVAAHDELALARGIIGAVKMGAHVISISLARPAQTSSAVRAAIEFAEQDITSYSGLELLRRYFCLLGLQYRIFNNI